MDKYDALISCVSWEDRFILGIENTLKSYDIDNCHLLLVEEFLNRTELNKDKADTLIEQKRQQDWLSVSIKDDLFTWKAIENYVSDNQIEGKRVLVDLSTMPRCLIWVLFHFLIQKNNSVDYIYYSPGTYSKGEWLSSDPESPRLVFKHSGIAYPDQKTVLLIQTGYDLERVSQLISQFEPVKILLAVQSGKQLENLERNLNHRREQLHCPEEMTHCFEIDAFSEDHGYREIENQLEEYKENYNVIMCSLGPKSGAVALFKLNTNHPEYGLVYTPANAYNATYSSGINYDNIQFGSLTEELF